MIPGSVTMRTTWWELAKVVVGVKESARTLIRASSSRFPASNEASSPATTREAAARGLQTRQAYFARADGV